MFEGREPNMPRQAPPKVDNTILEMALVGYQSQLDRLSERMAEIRAQLGQRGPGRPKAATIDTDHAGPKKRALTHGARARISAAQKKRGASGYLVASGAMSRPPQWK